MLLEGILRPLVTILIIEVCSVRQRKSEAFKGACLLFDARRGLRTSEAA